MRFGKDHPQSVQFETRKVYPLITVDYFPRVADAELATVRGAVGAVLIEGPKACGKTCLRTIRRMLVTGVRTRIEQRVRWVVD